MDKESKTEIISNLSEMGIMLDCLSASIKNFSKIKQCCCAQYVCDEVNPGLTELKML